MINVHIVDDHKVVVEGLKVLINESKNIKVSGVSYCLEECRKALLFSAPDLLLLDINLPDGNGIEYCSEVQKKYPEIKILILTTHSEYSVAKQALDNGVSGYIVKNALSEELFTGIETVMDGEIFVCDEIDILMKRKQKQQIWFTKREKEVLQGISDGLINQQIADKLYLSIETIKTYRKNLNQKVGAKNTIMLVNMARENNWI
jgi:DNA-binding NarL/FixJ family response regulator